MEDGYVDEVGGWSEEGGGEAQNTMLWQFNWFRAENEFDVLFCRK